MDSDGSSDEEYGPTELDELIQKEVFESPDSDEEVEMMMIMSIQQETDRVVEHILNFEGLIKARSVLNRNWVSKVEMHCC
jgi:hypothetical protein